MKVGDLVKIAADPVVDEFLGAMACTGSIRRGPPDGLGLILEQPQEGSSTVLWQKEQQVMTTWDAWLEVINEINESR